MNLSFWGKPTLLEFSYMLLKRIFFSTLFKHLFSLKFVRIQILYLALNNSIYHLTGKLKVVNVEIDTVTKTLFSFTRCYLLILTWDIRISILQHARELWSRPPSKKKHVENMKCHLILANILLLYGCSGNYLVESSII